MPHWLVSQTASALGSDGGAHVWHEAAVPQRVVLSSGKHPLTAGQVCVPAPQTVPHTAPAVHAEPVGQGVQSTPSIVPQVAVEVLLTHKPPQR
jgi:hypothetical protein